jgi:hypothetical protein
MIYTFDTSTLESDLQGQSNTYFGQGCAIPFPATFTTASQTIKVVCNKYYFTML